LEIQTSLGSLLRNQRDFLIELHYETESELCSPNKSFISWLMCAHSSGRLFLLLFSADGPKDRNVANIRFGRFSSAIRPPRGKSANFDRWSGGPAVLHNSIAACLARSRSGSLRAANGVVAVAIKPVEKILFDDRK
jgi:hypothetical protein